MRILPYVCIAYWILLTVLLLVPYPAAPVGLHFVPIFPWGKFGVHTSFFTILGVLVNFSRWPKRSSWRLIVFMAIYGITTEFLQRFVPPRTSQVIDGFENLLGIAIGTAIYSWAWCRWKNRLSGKDGRE
jgi:hypothetical protein